MAECWRIAKILRSEYNGLVKGRIVLCAAGIISATVSKPIAAFAFLVTAHFPFANLDIVRYQPTTGSSFQSPV